MPKKRPQAAKQEAAGVPSSAARAANWPRQTNVAPVDLEETAEKVPTIPRPVAPVDIEGEEPSLPALPAMPSTIGEAIRAAIKELGDPDANAYEIRKTVLRMFPGLFDQRIANDRNWNTYVSQNRDRAAEEMGIARRKRPRPRRVTEEAAHASPKEQLDYAAYQAARDFIARFTDGDGKKAKSLLDMLSEQDLGQLRVAVDAWLRLVESAGSAETAEKVLATLKEEGSIK